MPIRIAKGRARGGVTGAVAADERGLRGERMGIDERDARGDDLRDLRGERDARGDDLRDLRDARGLRPLVSHDPHVSHVISQVTRAPHVSRVISHVTRVIPRVSRAPRVSHVVLSLISP